MSSIQVAKKLLRSTMKKTLDALSQEEIHSQSKRVFNQVASNPVFCNATVVSCYVSMPTSELQTDDITRFILQEGKILFVPRIDSSRGEIDMLRIYDEEDLKSLTPKQLGIREPELYKDGILRENAFDTSSPSLDLILMPGVAFDKTFSRLGHGRGYYDRFLLKYNNNSSGNCESHNTPALYALSFTGQVLPPSTVPISEHDWQLDGIFHPEGFSIKFCMPVRDLEALNACPTQVVIIADNFPSKCNILFLGQDYFSCIVFKHLYREQELWNRYWVATNPDLRNGRRGKNVSASPLKLLAHSLNIPTTTVPPKSVGMKAWEVPSLFHNDTSGQNILITASFGRIIPTSILRLFRKEHRLNVHPSLLPLYRGPAPIQHAIAEGASMTGVSISTINPFKYGVDTGDVWASESMMLTPDITFDFLRQTLADAGGKLLVRTLREILTGTAQSTEQDHSQATPASHIKGEFMEIDWNTWDAFKLDRRHRAAHHQHSLRTVLPYGPSLQLEQISVQSPPWPRHSKLLEPGDAIFDPFSRSILIRCANYTEIRVTHLQQQNKRVLNAVDFWNGIRPEGLHSGILKLRSIINR